MYDPCARCKAPKAFRTLCQGTPFSLGFCTSAKDHWAFVGNHSVSGAAADSKARKMRQYIQSGRKGKP